MARMGFIDRWSRVLYGAFFVSALATLRRRVSPRAVATSEAVRAPTLLWASRVGCCTKAGRVMNRGHGETDAEIPALGRGAARLWTSYCPPGRGRATRPAGTSRRKKRAGSSSPRAAVRRTPPGLSVVAAPVASECLELLPQRRGRLSGRGMGRTTPKERRGLPRDLPTTQVAGREGVSQKRLRKPHKRCSYCGARAVAHGLCQHHYGRERRRRESV